MAQVTAAMVKELREMTDSPMMDCKKALVEADGDIEKAVDVLRLRGLAKSVKKAGRATNEGAVMTYISADGKTAGLAEVKCETDFVSATDKFKTLATKVAQAVCENDPADKDAFLASEFEGDTVSNLIQSGIAGLGENITLGRIGRLSVEDGAIASYIHMGGKIGVIIAFTMGNPATAETEGFKAMAHDVAMQVAASKPVCAVREDMPADLVEHERALYMQQAAESGKPLAIQEKMAAGRVEKFYKESTLVDQMFVKNPDITIQQYIDSCAKEIGDTIAVKAFKSFVLGE